MKRLLLVTLLLFAAAAHGQVFTDGKGLTVNAADFRIDKPRVDTKPTHLVLKKNVSVVSEPQGLNLTSDNMTLNALPVPKPGKGYRVNDAIATGNVVVIKSVASKSGKQTTRIEGSTADYKAGTKESTVTMNGPMTLKSVDEAGRPTTEAKGANGVAYFEPLKQTKLDNALHKATMDGDVHLTLTQYDSKTKTKTTVHTTSDHMLLEEQPDGKKVTLTGSVRISSEGLELKNFKRAIFVLKKDGELKMETSEAK